MVSCLPVDDGLDHSFCGARTHQDISVHSRRKNANEGAALSFFLQPMGVLSEYRSECRVRFENRARDEASGNWKGSDASSHSMLLSSIERVDWLEMETEVA